MHATHLLPLPGCTGSISRGSASIRAAPPSGVTPTPNAEAAVPDDRIFAKLFMTEMDCCSLGTFTLVVTMNGLPLPIVRTRETALTPSAAAVLARYAASSKLAASPTIEVSKLTTRAVAAVVDGAPSTVTGTPKAVAAEPDERMVSSLAVTLSATDDVAAVTWVLTANGLPLPTTVSITSAGCTSSSAATLSWYAASSKLNG